jgi:hypothetical protein
MAIGPHVSDERMQSRMTSGSSDIQGTMTVTYMYMHSVLLCLISFSLFRGITKLDLIIVLECNLILFIFSRSDNQVT